MNKEEKARDRNKVGAPKAVPLRYDALHSLEPRMNNRHGAGATQLIPVTPLFGLQGRQATGRLPSTEFEAFRFGCLPWAAANNDWSTGAVLHAPAAQLFGAARLHISLA